MLKLHCIAFHYSDFWPSLHPSLHRDLVVLPSNHSIVRVNGGTMSRPCKRPRLLQPSEIYEVVADSDSDEASVPSDVSSVDGRSGSVAGGSHPQPCFRKASCHESGCSISSSASDEEAVV